MRQLFEFGWHTVRTGLLVERSTRTKRSYRLEPDEPLLVPVVVGMISSNTLLPLLKHVLQDRGCRYMHINRVQILQMTWMYYLRCKQKNILSAKRRDFQREEMERNNASEKSKESLPFQIIISGQFLEHGQ